jgi:hypothetical protein
MTTPYEGWALLELMGHRQRAGRVAEAEQYGGKQLRIDIPLPDGTEITEFYGCSSVYALRPVTEEVARAAAARMADPRPISPTAYRQLDDRRSAYHEINEEL